jgi:hypothetical protein
MNDARGVDLHADALAHARYVHSDHHRLEHDPVLASHP